jgi:REP element-mobilizing transposase RayT
LTREIYWDEKDYDFFKKWLGRVCVQAGWKVHAWTLMPNHYHLLIEIRRKTLVSGMQLLNAEYTRHFNRQHQLSGPLFQGRYKATLVEGKAGYLRTVVDYIHLNPMRAKFCKTMEGLVGHRETSVGCYVRGEFPEWMEWRKVMAAATGRERKGVRDRQQFYEHLEGRLKAMGEEEPEWKRLRRSWCWSGEALREKFEKALGLMRGKSEAGEIWQRGLATQTEESIAERMVKAHEKKRNCRVKDLLVGEKYRLALGIREQSCVSIRWLSQRFGVKSEGAMRRGISVHRLKKNSASKKSQKTS